VTYVDATAARLISPLQFSSRLDLGQDGPIVVGQFWSWRRGEEEDRPKPGQLAQKSQRRQSANFVNVDFLQVMMPAYRTLVSAEKSTGWNRSPSRQTSR
jgi:hypothetical protein